MEREGVGVKGMVEEKAGYFRERERLLEVVII